MEHFKYQLGLKTTSLRAVRHGWKINYPHIHLKIHNFINFWATEIKCHDFINVSLLHVLTRKSSMLWTNHFENLPQSQYRVNSVNTRARILCASCIANKRARILSVSCIVNMCVRLSVCKLHSGCMCSNSICKLHSEHVRQIISL